MIIDTHCHVIDLEYDNIDEIINRFKDNIMIISGYDSISNRNVVDIVKKYKNSYKNKLYKHNNKIIFMILNILIYLIVIILVNI